MSPRRGGEMFYTGGMDTPSGGLAALDTRIARLRADLGGEQRRHLSPAESIALAHDVWGAPDDEAAAWAQRALGLETPAAS